MKKLMILFTLLFLSWDLPAPHRACCYIEQPELINYYEPLIRAVVKVESNNGRYTYNSKENSVGWFHIRQIRIDDFNNKTDSHYTLQDCYDYAISRRVFLYYTYNEDYESVARRWNGWKVKPSTDIYWNKIKVLL
jgi:hypothetical protein